MLMMLFLCTDLNMKYITSTNRNQVELHCLDALIKKDNAVRFIEAFVNKVDLKQLHFVSKKEGPAITPKYF